MQNFDQDRCGHYLSRLKNELDGLSTLTFTGKIQKAGGAVIRATGVAVRIGEQCILTDPNTGSRRLAEVIGLDGETSILTPLGDVNGLSAETRVVATGQYPSVNVTDELLGCVVDAHGLPLDKSVRFRQKKLTSIYTQPPCPLQRRSIETAFVTRIRAIDSLITVGEGQRLGIFSAAGTGKSTLLSMLAHNSDADVNVIHNIQFIHIKQMQTNNEKPI